MPAFAISAILGGLVQIAGTLVGRILLSLGIGYTMYSGLDTSLNWVRDQAIANFQGLPAMAIQVAGLAKVGTCISIITSALSARMALNGMVNGAIKKMAVK
ncbi:DUF2523 domain-containing protein [Pelomonas sp. APW6]|uniref:DUF2523 domain-containing protein n=1 Tax=Roseateles subflavus TaxID=3053353 RepID=A0ABT7LR13_9BURK|nr:DUF2523 domain-containing protein [Pelomonas sp. APW6]MDL5034662.1 DUF2523 domain-containing protein [Pelomonas sp. APW6]